MAVAGVGVAEMRKDELAIPVEKLDQEQLDERIAAAHSRCSRKGARLAEEYAAGATAKGAAKAAGLSPRGGAPWMILKRPEVAELVALLRERTRRAAQVTREGQVARIQKLGRDAEACGDHGAALRAEDMVNKLANLYQDTQVVVGAGAVQVLVVNTGLPARDAVSVLLEQPRGASPGALPSAERVLPEVSQPCGTPGDTKLEREVTSAPGGPIHG